MREYRAPPYDTCGLLLTDVVLVGILQTLARVFGTADGERGIDQRLLLPTMQAGVTARR